MDLVQGRSARQRNDFVLRLGCWMVTLSMVCSLVIQPPKAKAIVAEASLATSVIWAFMQSAGITLNGTGMNSSSWAEGIEPYLREFTEATDSAAKSFWHWLGYENGAADFIKALSWSKITHPSTMPFPSVTIPPAVAKKLARFTVWFAEKVGLTAGSQPVAIAGSNILNTVLSGYHTWAVAHGWLDDYDSCMRMKTKVAVYSPSGVFSYDKYVYWLGFSDQDYSFVTFDKETMFDGVKYSPGLYLDVRKTSTDDIYSMFFYSDFSKRGTGGAGGRPFAKICDLSPGLKTSEQASSITVAQPGALSPTYDDTEEKATIITIPGLDTEIAGINELLQAILDKLAANELTTSATIAQQPTPEQPDEEKPDLDGLGLPALGAVLMTRFPFSIPWDVVRGIKLLAAPAEAPYWEVDFLAPIAGRVGGWKGSTKVVIDMGQYEIIGQLCRWTSTIGFCLVLAAGTKKLIWTA
nr:MAG TPA: hypothetical protein [Inoviridae sp.]